MTIDLTDLTRHPDWPQLALLFQRMESQAVDQLKAKVNPESNQLLIALNRVKSEIASRSKTPNVWKVQPHA